MGLIDVYRINPADQFSVFSPSLKKTQEITYYTLLAKIRGDLNITSTSGNAAQWDEAYNETIISGVVTGYQTKTITLTRRDGSEISFSFQDLNPVSEDTLDMVTTRGNTTVNTIDVGGVRSDYFLFDTSATPTMQVGMMAWNAQDGTADLRLMGNNVTLQIGQEQVVRVVNKTGGDLLEANYQVVKITGAQGNRLKVGLARADSDANSADTIGIVTETIENNQEGFVTNSGLVRNINTTGSLQGETWVDGNVLYLSPTTYGRITNIKPLAPQHTVIVGFVVRSHPTQGQIFVKVDNGYEIDELHNVRITSVTNNQVLKYNSTLQVWENVDISTLATTLAFSTIAVTGQSSIVADTTQDTLNISPGTGISLTTNASTDTLTITNSAPDQIVSLTGAGTTSISGTYPSFTITSNDQYVGTVTSVSTSAPITGGTITTSGTIGITQAGSSSDGYLSSTDWNTFNSKSGYAFKTIAVAGQSSIVADAADDTLTVASGTGITLTTNASTDTLTITNNAPDQTVVLTAGTGISTSGTYPSFTITNTAPDHTVVLTAGIGITTSGTYPNFTITNNDRGSSQNIFKNFAVSGQSTIVADSNDDTLTVASGTGISLATNAVSDTLTITNTAPDQTVVLTAGTGISTSGTYPSFTITNTAPDQTVVLTAGTGITTSGTYPSFTITNNDRGSSQNIFKNVAVPTQSTITAANNNDTFTLKPGPGVSITTLTANNNITIANTDPGSSQYIFKNIAVSGQSTIVADINDDTLTVASGTGISVTTDAVTDTLTFTNTAPDQTVALTAGTGISVTGTYPNFTITNSSPSSGGTVTSIATTAPITGGTITSTGTIGITQSGASTSGFLSSTDWNTFNNKQNALTNPITGTGTTNYVSKFTGTTTLGNSQIFDNGTNVGIGTATPSVKLHVVGGTALIKSNVNNGSPILTIHTNDDLGYTFSRSNTTGFLELDGNQAGYIGYVFKNGNVGIGTTTPTTRLDILGTSNADVTLQLKANASNDYSSKIFFSDNVSNRGVILYSNWQNYFSFFTNSAERVRITSAGNVGIGTTSPATILDVNGTISAGGFPVISNSGNYNRIHRPNGTIGIYLGNATDAGNYYDNSTHYFRSSGGGTTYAVISAAGNVGIGTTSPSVLLEANGVIRSTRTGVASQYVEINGGDAVGPFITAAGVNKVLTIQNNSTTSSVIRFNQAVASEYTWLQAGTERMRISSTGNVGIGATNPGALLQVGVSNVTADALLRLGVAYDTSRSSRGGITWHDESNTTGKIYTEYDGTMVSMVFGSLYNSGYNSNNLMIIRGNGNVGIGTTTPAQPLVVSNGGAAGFEWVPSTGRWYRYNRSTAAYAGIYTEASEHTWSIGTSEAMRINSSGNVGIGTTSPAHKLSVVGNGSGIAHIGDAGTGGGNYVGASFNGTLSTSNYNILSSPTDPDLNINRPAGNSIRFREANAEQMRILSGGNVGIGTTSPAHKLDVVGNISLDEYLYHRDNLAQYLRFIDTSTTQLQSTKINFSLGSTSSPQGGDFQFASTSGSDFTVSYTRTGQAVWKQKFVNQTMYWENNAGNIVYFANNSGNVGIGTTSPVERLSLSGATGTTLGLSIEPTGWNGAKHRLTVPTSGDASVWSFNYNGSAVDSALYATSSMQINQGNILFSTGATNTAPSERMRINSSGNLLIGTTTDSGFKFEAIGTGRFSQTTAIPLTVQRTTANSNVGIRYQNNTTSWYSGLAADDSFSVSFNDANLSAGQFKVATTGAATFTSSITATSFNGTTNNILSVGGTERMRIDSSGNVGIGTTSPSARLDVSGIARATSLSAVNGLGLNVAGYAYLSQTISGAMTLLGHNVRASDSVANTAIVQNAGWISSLIKMYYNEGITFHTDSTVYAAGATYPLATTERMRIQVNGNVGIGTTSPWSRFTVSGALSASTSQISIVNTEGGHSIIQSGIAGVSNNGISFVTANVDGSSQNVRMVVGATGNVGIGTNSPTVRLDVNGRILAQERITLNDSANTAQLQFLGLGSNVIGLQARNPSTTAAIPFSMQPDGGNVGIGTTAPSSILHTKTAGGEGLRIQGTASSAFIRYTDASNVSTAFIGQNTTFDIYNQANTAMRFGTNDSERMRITSTGNVGIGTTSPSASLHIGANGGVIFGATAGAVGTAQITTTSATSPVSTRFAFGTDGTGWQYRIAKNTAGTIVDLVTVADNGRVGIGTTSPSTLLHVEGRIYAGDIGIATTSPTQKLHVVGNARITGAIFDSLNSSGTAGQVLSSTGTGTEWVTGGGGGGSTIIVKDEGTTVGSSFTTLDFYGSNIQAGASGSTAVITALNNAGTGSVYSNDTTAQYAPTASFANVEINTVTVEATAPDTAGTTQKLIATVTFGVENVSSFDNWNNFSFRLYNSNASSAIADTEHIWSAWMSKDEGVTRTVFTFHIPLYDGVGASDVVTVQAKQSTAYTPEIYYCAITLIEGTN